MPSHTGFSVWSTRYATTRQTSLTARHRARRGARQEKRFSKAPQDNSHGGVRPHATCGTGGEEGSGLGVRATRAGPELNMWIPLRASMRAMSWGVETTTAPDKFSACVMLRCVSPVPAEGGDGRAMGRWEAGARAMRRMRATRGYNAAGRMGPTGRSFGCKDRVGDRGGPGFTIGVSPLCYGGAGVVWPPLCSLNGGYISSAISGASDVSKAVDKIRSGPKGGMVGT